MSAGGGEPPSKSSFSECSPPSPHSIGEKKTDTPPFSVKKWITSNWREAITIAADNIGEYPQMFATQDSMHMMRIYELAVKKHQELGCGKGGKVDCVFCHAQGGQNPWKGDSKKKVVSLSLYLEVIKHFIPEEVDYCSKFPDEAQDPSASEDIRHLDVNAYFFESLFPMLYCSKCYPDLPRAVEAMDTLQKYNPAFERDKGKDSSSFYADRQKVLSELKAIKATKRQEFSTALKQVSIMSKFDWELHKMSDKYLHKEVAKPVSHELQDVKSLLESVKQPIVSLEVRMSVSSGKTAEGIASKLLENEKIRMLVSHSSSCVDFMSIVQEKKQKTQLEEVVESCFEKVLKEKAGELVARKFAEDQKIANILLESHATYEYFTKEISDDNGNPTTHCELVFHKLLSDAIDEKLTNFKTDVIEPMSASILKRIEDLLSGSKKKEQEGEGGKGGGKGGQAVKGGE